VRGAGRPSLFSVCSGTNNLGFLRRQINGKRRKRACVVSEQATDSGDRVIRLPTSDPVVAVVVRTVSVAFSSQPFWVFRAYAGAVRVEGARWTVEVQAPGAGCFYSPTGPVFDGYLFLCCLRCQREKCDRTQEVWGSMSGEMVPRS